ncbi:hypothetical protein LR004_01375 [Candidatus Gracilibacteria bacterium]|nr:hypothetical protein [Candidatus Gracilibacteria bacterium]
MFLKELQRFSKSNWWVYIMLVIILGIVYYTGNGNLVEIILLFIANFLANLFVMIAISNYSRQMNKIGSLYHVASTSFFTFIGAYGAVFNGEYQYLLFQVTFILAATKAITTYTFQKNAKLINEKSVGFLNVILLGFFVYYFSPEIPGLLQGLGFAIVTTGLVSIKDSFRFFMNLIGSVFIVIGSLIVVISSFNQGNLDGIALGFLLLTGTAIIYFLKLLPSYIAKLKNNA